MGCHDEAVGVLRAAVRQDDRNPLGAPEPGRDAASDRPGRRSHSALEAATRLLPGDQLAWLGLADAHRLAGKTKEAERTYRTAIEINPHTELAEKARRGSNLLAQSGFARTQQVFSRQDAVHYCLAAMKRYAQMSPGDFQKLTLELAVVGRDGFKVHDPASRYHVKGLDGEYSGLAMVCLLYVAMQRMAPGTNIGFDLAAEYEEAKKLFTATG